MSSTHTFAAKMLCVKTETFTLDNNVLKSDGIVSLFVVTENKELHYR